MPVVKVSRAGVRSAPREVPTDTTAAVLPMPVERVGQECAQDEQPTRVSGLAEGFEKFKPNLDFKTSVGECRTEFVAELEFKSLKDFDPKKVRSGEPGKRHDLADLQSRIDLLRRMRDRFAVLSVRKAREHTDQRKEIIDAVAAFEQPLRNIAGGDRVSSFPALLA